MVLILKLFGQNRYKLVKLSSFAYPADCRITDMVDTEICYDHINRIQFYREIIDKLISDNHEIRPYSLDEVTNTLHDRIIRHFKELRIEIYLVEVSNQYFPFNQN